MITFIIPFYNEESKNSENLKTFLKVLAKYILQNKNKDYYFLLFNDGSTDKTLKYIENFIKNKNKKKVIFINFKKNKGQGAIFRKGLELCKTKYLIFIPSDGDTPFFDYKKFIKKKVDLVLFYVHNLENYSSSRLFLSSLFNSIYNFSFGTKIHYIQGPALYNKSKLKKISIKSSNISSHSEMAIKLLHSNITYCEYPYNRVRYSEVDRSVTIKSFLNVTFSFLRLLLEVKLTNKKLSITKSKRILI